MIIAGAPAGAFHGEDHLVIQRAVIGTELGVVWIAGLCLLVDAARAARDDPPTSPLFARSYPAIYLGVLVVLWLISLPAYFGATDGLTKQGTPVGSLWYSVLCATAATGFVLAARRATVSRPIAEPVRS